VVIPFQGDQENRAWAAPSVGNNSTKRLTTRYKGIESPVSHSRHLALRGQQALEKTPVSPSRHTDDPYSAGVDRSYHDLSVETALKLVGEPESHAANRLERGLLCLSLGESYNLRPTAHSLEQPPKIILDHRQSARLEPVGQQQSYGSPGLSVEYEHPAFHPLHSTLLLIPSALEPAVDRDDLCY
jgi:hypothetical protein